MLLNLHIAFLPEVTNTVPVIQLWFALMQITWKECSTIVYSFDYDPFVNFNWNTSQCCGYQGHVQLFEKYSTWIGTIREPILFQKYNFLRNKQTNKSKKRKKERSKHRNKEANKKKQANKETKASKEIKRKPGNVRIPDLFFSFDSG